jgi:hypothetical protein
MTSTDSRFCGKFKSVSTVSVSAQVKIYLKIKLQKIIVMRRIFGAFPVMLLI